MLFVIFSLFTALPPSRAFEAQCESKATRSFGDQTALLQQDVGVTLAVLPNRNPIEPWLSMRAARYPSNDASFLQNDSALVLSNRSNDEQHVLANSTAGMFEIVRYPRTVYGSGMGPISLPTMQRGELVPINIVGQIRHSSIDANLSAWKLVVFGLGSVLVFYVLAYIASTWNYTAPKQGTDMKTENNHSRGVSNSTDASVSAHGAPLPTSTILWRISPLIPVILMKAFSTGVTEPSKQFIDINFFASHHTDLPKSGILCELSLLTPHCQQGVRDVMKLSVGLGFIPPVMSFLFAPMLGAISDGFGRRYVIVICKILMFIDLAFRAAYVYFDWSLYISYWLSPLANLPYLPVYYAYLIDCIDHPPTVVVCIALIEAVTLLFILVGMFVGLNLHLAWAYSAGFIASATNLAYTLFILPESLAPDKRKPLKTRNLLPFIGLRILVRNKLIRTLAIISVMTGFCTGCFNFMTARFLQLYLGWDMKKTYFADIVLLVSCMLWLSVGMRLLSHRLGEVGLIFFCNVLSSFGLILFFFSHAMWHIYALSFFLIGSTALSLPALAALYSRVVPTNEQGRMQGSLETLTSISTGVGQVFGFIMFQATDYVFNRTTAAAILTLIYIVLLKLALFYLIWSLRIFVREPQAKSTKC